MFVTALRSHGYEVETATDIFGQGTDDRRLLEHCGEERYVFVTHDKKDFGGKVGETVDHAGIIIYTEPAFIRHKPDQAVRLVERVLEHYPPEELTGEQIWLRQWRE